jgi:Bacterial Ig-like domain (group 3)
MTRVLTRAILLTAIGGLALAPAIASAADTGPDTTPPASTVTQLTSPKDPQAGEMLTISAKVGLKDSDPTDTPTQTAHAKKPVEAAKGGSGKSGTKGKGGKGKGKGAKGGGTHQKRHAAETGEVTFTVDGKALTPVPLTRGRASEKLELAAGKHTVTASYSGDQNYTASQSVPLTLTVG